MNLTLALLLNLGVSLAAPPLELSPPACQIAGVTMVPGRALAEWLGASAALDASGRELTVQIQGRAGSLRFAAGHGRAVVVGLPAALPHVPIRAANDLYVPLRFLAEQLETTVAWDAAARQALLTRGQREGLLAVQPECYPLVDGQISCLIGGRLHGRWAIDTAMAAALQGGERYQTFGLADSMGTVTGGRPGIEQPGEFQRVELQPETEALASGAPWLLTPRRARAQALDQPAYLGAVRSILAQNGLPKAKPRLTQVLRVDLEGDGREEVLLAAESPDFVKPSIEPNSYSLVALRRVVGNGVKTTLLAGEFHARAAEFAAPAGYQVAAVADLDGDDILEIVVRWAYYEGAGAGVFQLRGGQPKEVIASGMGA